MYALKTSKDDKTLGEWFLTGRNSGFKPDEWEKGLKLTIEQPSGRMFFPKAKSVKTNLVGSEIKTQRLNTRDRREKSTGFSQSANHLSPLANPGLFI